MARPQVSRAPVRTAGADGFGRFDYADAFEARLPAPDPRGAVDWLRAGLEGSPRAIQRLIVHVHRHVLRLRLAPDPDAPLDLWQVTRDDPDEAHLEAQGPLIDGRLVAHRVAPDRVRLDTFVRFNRRPAAALVWYAVGPLHRAVAPRLVRRAATADEPGEASGSGLPPL